MVAEIQTAIDKVTASEEWKSFQKDQKQESPDLKEEEFTALAKKQLQGQSDFLKEAGLTK